MAVEELECDMVKKKIEKLWNRCYITNTTVLILISFFHVHEGDSDIRLVYDLIAFGLNEYVLDTKLCMTSAENVLDTSTHSS